MAGTLITTYTTAGREGRTARAKVRERLAETEDLRWLIRKYAYLAEVAHYTEITERQENPQLPPRTLPLDFAFLMDVAVLTVSNEAWRPRFWRFHRKRQFWLLDSMILRRRQEHPDWAWDAVLFAPKLKPEQPGIRPAIKRYRQQRRKQDT